MTSSSERNPRRRNDSHGWNALDNYLKIHHGYLDGFRDYFVLEANLEEQFVTADVFEIRGRIRCDRGLFIDVDKTLQVNERGQVRTIKYSYHAGMEGPDDRPIFRYDNAHTYRGHADEHHKHSRDPSTWEEFGRPIWVGRDQWPHLNDIIEELREWWETTGRHLG